MSSAQRNAAIERLIDALPDWFTALVQLNALVAERMGLVVTDFQCLHELNRSGPATAAALAERIGLTAGSVSRMIDRLEAATCVRRVPDPGDRRKTLIEPTPEGLDKAASYYAGLTVSTREDLATLTDEQVHTLLHFVRAAYDSTAAEITRLRADP